MDSHLRDIESAFAVTITRRNESFSIEGGRAQAERAAGLLQTLYDHAQQPMQADAFQLSLIEAAADSAGRAIHLAPGVVRGTAPDTASGAAGKSASAAAVAADVAHVGTQTSTKGATVLRTRRADLAGRTPNQHTYLSNILAHDITFGIGPAGTGKTFLAVACAIDALERSSVQRIVLTRPAVEAGERLGFLPGDLAQKVDPYLRPLYDALYDLMGIDKVTRAFEKATIEIAPLAFMRGRTLNNAFVILDEAQNTTPEQMKMFLTRVGFGSKCVITGDISQIDLPRGQMSGLIDAERVLKRVRGIATTRFTSADVVRHPLVARIVDAYDAARTDSP
jgi:phosphate starvation-inducible protein PhoH and related proteins